MFNTIDGLPPVTDSRRADYIVCWQRSEQTRWALAAQAEGVRWLEAHALHCLGQPQRTEPNTEEER